VAAIPGRGVTTGADVVAAARQYLGTRWHHQGRNTAGLDCIGLVIVVAHDLGLSEYDICGYSRVPDGRTLRATMERQLLQVSRDPQPGDILLFTFARVPLHTAIVTDTPSGLGMIHAYANVRKVVEHRLDDLWRSRIAGVYTYPGVSG
jgi:cell wall-associated NlpC family hydrolase